MNIIEALIIIGGVFGIISFIFGLLSLFFGLRLDSYIKKHKYEKWCATTGIHTSLGDLDGGTINSWKSWKYINNNQDTEDIYINKFKIIIRRTTKLFCLFFISSLSVFALATLVIFYKRGN